MSSTIKIRGDIYSNWILNNPILFDRELIAVTDLLKFKIGDGTSRFSQLKYTDKSVTDALDLEIVNRQAGDSYLQGQLSSAVGGLRGGIDPGASAPEPGASGYYDFVIDGECTWITSGTETVNALDRVYVNYTALPTPSYEYIYVPAELVRSYGDETINGIKTFTSFPVTPSLDPSDDYEVSNKKYVDDTIEVAKDTVINESNIYNITAQIPLEVGQFYTAGTARAAVPELVKKNGLVITYALGYSDWVTEKFIGATYTEFWVNDVSWEKQLNQNEILSINGYMNITTLSNSIRSTLIGVMNAVTDIYIEGNVNLSAKYCISSISNGLTGATISIFEVVGSTRTRVCEFYAASSSYRTGFETVELSEYQNSGISGICKIDWYMIQGSAYANLYEDTHYLNRKAFNPKLFINIDETNINVTANSLYISDTELKIATELSLMKANDSSFLDIEMVNDGYIVAATGDINSNQNIYGYSNTIPILPGKTIILDGFAGSSSVFKIQYFDRNISKLNGIASDLTHIVSIVPDNARYVRFCNLRADSVGYTIKSIGLNIDNALVGLYPPLNQLNNNHTSEDIPLGYRYIALRTKIFNSDVITNVIKIKTWAVSDLSIWDYSVEQPYADRKLLIADSDSIINPSSMSDISDNIDEIILSNTVNEPTIIVLKNPIRIPVDSVIVFAWNSYPIFNVSVNGLNISDTTGKLPLLISNETTDMWDSDWIVGSGSYYNTPSFELLLDEKFELSNYIPRTTGVIANTSNFQYYTNTTTVDGKPSISLENVRRKNLQFNIDTHIERFRFVVAFKITTLSSGGYVSIGKYSVPYYGSAEVRLFSNKVEFWVSDYYGDETILAGDTKIYTIPITEITIGNGSEIAISIEKARDGCIIKINDGNIYGETSTYLVEKYVSKGPTEENIPLTELFAMMWGFPFIASYNCSYTIKDISFSSPYLPSLSKISVWGDSFIEGSTMIPFGLSNRYVSKLSDGIESYVPIFGKGGERLSKTWFENFIIENDWFKTKYVLIALGTNNTDIGEYFYTLKAVIYHLEKNNQIPVLVTVTPREDTPNGEAVRIFANDYIRSSRHLFIDSCRAVTIQPAELYWKPGLLLDGVHPTVDGHNAIYKRFDLDVPELFNI